MSDLTLNLSPAATTPAGDKLLAVPRLPAAPVPRKAEGRTRRRFGATRLAPPSDDGFRLFRVY